MLTLRYAILTGILLPLVGCGLMHGRVKPQELDNPPQHVEREATPVKVDVARAESRPAAERGLAQMQELGKQGQLQLLGFSNVEELQKARLDRAIPILGVRLDDLRAFGPNSDPRHLVEAQSPRVFYGVQVQERLRSALVVSHEKKGWEATEFGQQPLFKMLPPDAPRGDTSVFVAVPAFNVYFYCPRYEREADLLPLADYPQFSFKRGTAVPLREAMERLARAAKEHNGQPT